MEREGIKQNVTGMGRESMGKDWAGEEWTERNVMREIELKRKEQNGLNQTSSDKSEPNWTRLVRAD